MCENCSYIERTRDKDYNLIWICHRYPNKVFVDRYYWCGEFKKEYHEEDDY